MNELTIGMTAHVDSGKTTLAEAILYKTGAIRRLGRVDNGDSTLDTDPIERERGITIFSSQAEFNAGGTHFTLLDTPGHIDFSSETERTVRVLDYAVLVISGTDGVQSHTRTLWELLRKYEVPVFIFVNKMDLAGADREAVLNSLHSRLSGSCVDMTRSFPEVSEYAASCSEELMEKYLSAGVLGREDIAAAVSRREIFPCFFGSALRGEGIDELISALCDYTVAPQYSGEFGARVYKISYDSKGTRLTHMKLLGGSLNMRGEVSYEDADGVSRTEKISSIRYYTGEKFRNAEAAHAGEVCAVTGLTATFAGQGIGHIRNTERSYIEPVMTYRVSAPPEKSIYDVLHDLRELEDTDPQLHVVWNEQNREIHLQLMGRIQLEVLEREIPERYGYSIELCDGAVAYKETVRTAVEGVGHYEPLKHYGEVHILLEPLPAGSGLMFGTTCSEDVLDRNWQRLILTHLAEREHIGVLTGSPVTDMKMTLVAGKTHLKHTEGGDLRQATYRAVRQGLRTAGTVLLEPYYEFELEVPSVNVGRAISDLQHMSADMEPPETAGEMAVIRGTAPVSELNSYQADMIAYTRGRGRLSLAFSGYRECHDAERVIAEIGYDCDSDVENSADSIFCSHGAGYNVKWNEVYEHMHIPLATGRKDAEDESAQRQQRAARFVERAVSDEELMAFFEMTYGKLRSDPIRAFKKAKAVSLDDRSVHLPKYEGPSYLIVDGYNIIFAWDDLRKIADESLDAARGELIHRMCNYQGYAGCELILVFDAYKVKGKHREVERYCNISIVYTQESETADTYIERVSHTLSKDHRVYVATSDGVEQMVILGNGAMRISAAELRKRWLDACEAIREYIENMH